ncbi:MAG: CPBP family intramembrane metalloprotease [Lachnospiraceae bacterium]|nr:CPBP family intramembrane metalloprotease [Lachnospiraceae bacterium]
MGTTKSGKHGLCEKAPVIAMLLTVVIGALPSAGGLIPNPAGYIAISVLSIVLLILFNMWFKPEFEGVFKAHLPLKEILIITSTMSIMVVGSVISNILCSGFVIKASFTYLCMAIMAGVNEETMYRAMIIPVGMRYLKGQHRAWMVIVISSLVFGPMHLTNIFAGADVGMTLVQTVMATCGGIILGAIYLRTGSVIPGMAAHALYDFVNFATDPTINPEGVVIAGVSTNENLLMIICIVMSVFLGLSGCFLIRKSKLDVIEEIWRKKWE